MRLQALAFAFALLGAALAPAPTAVQAQVVTSENATPVTGRGWSGVVEWEGEPRRNWTLEFREDGVLVYAYDGRTFDNGRWTQNGAMVTFQLNNYFAVYVGRLDANGGLEGVNYNRRGKRGTFSFNRRRSGSSGRQ